MRFGLAILLALLAGVAVGKYTSPPESQRCSADARGPEQTAKAPFSSNRRQKTVLPADRPREKVPAQPRPREEVHGAVVVAEETDNFSATAVEAEEMSAEQRADAARVQAEAEYTSFAIATGDNAEVLQTAADPPAQEIQDVPIDSVESEEIAVQQRAEFAATQAEAEYSQLVAAGDPAGLEEFSVSPP